MPESVTDRPASAIEYVFLLSKRERYFFDMEAVRVPYSSVSIKRLSQPNFENQTGGPKDPKSGNRSHRKTLNNQREKLIRQEKWKIRREGWEEMDKTLGRSMRNTDLFYESLSNPYGLISNGDGEAIALDVNPAPFPAEYCTACKGYYEGASKSRIRVEKVMIDGKEKILRWCPCGRHDAWLSHFATFGPNLIEPLIKAGTSEKGCCPECGAPWKREVERTNEIREDFKNSKFDAGKTAARDGGDRTQP